jgi:hypothetical protein
MAARIISKIMRVRAVQELTMKHLAFAIGLCTLGIAAATPARADFALVRYGNGHCRIWWDSGANPWGTDWTKIVIGLPTWSAADAALVSYRAQGVCP